MFLILDYPDEIMMVNHGLNGFLIGLPRIVLSKSV